jgi:hypothetical protein
MLHIVGIFTVATGHIRPWYLEALSLVLCPGKSDPYPVCVVWCTLDRRMITKSENSKHAQPAGKSTGLQGSS